jgi:hypothetical protein
VVYTTFHHPVTQANVVTTEYSDWATNCPEYKVTAVQVAPSNGPSDWQARYEAMSTRHPPRAGARRMSARPERLIYMANQIARFFAAQPGDPAAGVAGHLKNYWDHADARRDHRVAGGRWRWARPALGRGRGPAGGRGAVSGFAPFPRARWTAAGAEAGSRDLPEETAIALVHDAATTAVMMATPADLEDFGVGFSLTEGLVDSAEAITGLEIAPPPRASRCGCG